MLNRRDFIQNSMLTGIGITLGGPTDMINQNLKNEDVAFIPAGSNDKVQDEAYWKQIRGMFQTTDDFINLENGYFSPQPKTTLAFHQAREQYVNTRTSWFMRREQEAAISSARNELAAFLGCVPNELALTRNTTESMNILTSGYPWKAGDEIIIGNQDYGSMVSAFHQVSRRYGVIIKVAQVPMHPMSEAEVVNAYSSLFTKRTKLVHLTHMIHLTGQIIPVTQIAVRAKGAGIEVSVDVAHSVAHVQFNILELEADYVAGSLHKWLCNPLGAGFLWVKQERIRNLYPLMADEEFLDNDIRKFEHQGTRPLQTLDTIKESIRFHKTIGGELKQNRLRYLMRYWVNKVVMTPGIKINTPYNNVNQHGAIGNIAIDGYTPEALADKLLSDYKIFTVAINHDIVKGVRITPHIYNSLEELDKLVVALNEIANKK